MEPRMMFRTCLTGKCCKVLEQPDCLPGQNTGMRSHDLSEVWASSLKSFSRGIWGGMGWIWGGWCEFKVA